MRFVTTDPRSAGLADSVGSVLGYVTGGALYTLVKAGTGNTDWAHVRPVVIPAPMESTKCPAVATDPSSGGRAGNIGEIVLYYTGGVGVYYIKYGTGSTDWVPLPDNNAGGPTGSGTAGRSTRWTAATVVGTGAFTDNGTNVSLNGTADFNGAVNMDSTLTLSTMTAGSVLFAGVGGLVSQDNANLFWDDSNNRLGIGTNGPAATIDIVSSIATITSIGRLQSLNPNGNSSFDFYDEGGVNRFGIGYDNLPNRAQISMNNGSDFVIVENATGQKVRFFNNGNVNIGPTTTDPGVMLYVEGDTTIFGQLLAKGENTNTAPTVLGGVELFGGRTNAGGLAGSGSSKPDVAFNWGGASGGFRHWLSTWHDSVAGSGNRLRFHINSGAAAGSSSAPGTGNVLMLDLQGAGSVLGAATTDSHTVNGRAALTSVTATASAFSSTFTPVAGTTSALAAGVFTNNGTYNTTAVARTEYAITATSTSTRSSGANDLTNTALYATASGAQVNVALQTDAGSNYLNTTSGNTGIGYALGATLPQALSVTGSIYATANLQIDGNATLGNAGTDVSTMYLTIVRGGNTNTAPSNLAGMEFHTGRASGGALVNANQTVADVAFDYGGNSGGYRHWISTEHDTTATTANALRFWINTSGTAGGSSGPGTGNTNVLDLYGDTSAKFYGGLTVADNAGFGTAKDSNAQVAVTQSSARTYGLYQTHTASATTADRVGFSFSMSGTFDTTSGVLTNYGILGNAQATRSAGANALQNIAVAGYAAGAQANYSFYGIAGTLYNAGDLTADGTATLNGNTVLGNATSDVHTVTGDVTIGGDGTSLTINGAANQQYVARAINAQTGQTATDVRALQGEVTGSLNTTGAAATAYGVLGVSSGSRSSGANDLTNIGIYGYAANGQVNYSFYGAAGTLYNAGAATIDGAATLNSTLSVTGTFTSKGTTVLCDGTGDTLKFYGGTGATQQTVSGSRGGNAALADLLTKLATLGLIVDGTSA